jgi:hypothetical protein
MSLRATIFVKTMAHSARSLRIGIASLVALLLIGGAYVISGPIPFWNVVEAQSAEELLREYAGKDSDTDGLPDWQESLYGTDPYNPESFQAGIKDGEAVAQGLIEPRVTVRPEDQPVDPSSIPGTVAAPSSLTDQFSQNLLRQYLLSRGENPPTPEEVTAFVTDALSDLAQTSQRPDTFTNADVVPSPEAGTLGLTNYVARAENALATENIRPAKNELFYFSDAVKGDSGALSKIEQISDAYEASSEVLMQISVPEEARRAHLSIANALAGMSAVTADLASLESDPLRALVGLASYDRQATELAQAFAGMHGILAARQVSVPSGQAGAEFIFLAEDSYRTVSEMEQ